MIGLQIPSAGDKNALYDRYEHNFDDDFGWWQWNGNPDNDNPDNDSG